MSTEEYWQEKKRAAHEEPIDPSFSAQQSEALQSLAQLQQHEAQDLEAESQNNSSETFDVAAAAVAASSNEADKADEIPVEAPAPSEHVPIPQPIQASQPVEDEVPLNRAGKPLTNTKRAHQNRMAQRAFRQRKEAYIKELEEKSREVETLKKLIEELRAENNQLRDYSLTLQAKLIEQPDVPTPPIFNGRTKKN